MPDPAALLASVFGFQGFRPGQEEIVRAVLAGRNTLAIMPTGGGKSLCFQLPALCRDGVTIVLSPLIALMRDQVRALRQAGVEAGALTSGNTDEETEQVFAALDEGRLKLLYIAPERLASPATLPLLRRIGVSLIAVDEAHCVSQWGHDFRPDYLRIGDLRRSLGVPLAAFTATADEETRGEIVTRLFDGVPPETFLRGFDRPNIHLAFAAKDSPRDQILRFAAARKGQSGIVYCGTRAKTETLAQAMREAGHNALAYHAGLDPDERRHVETRFQRDDGLIVVATVAFGMGIDKPDIRWVAHADLPKSIEGTIRKSAAPAAMARRPRRSPSTAPTTSASAAPRSTRGLPPPTASRPITAASTPFSAWPRRSAAGGRPSCATSARMPPLAATAISATARPKPSTAPNPCAWPCRPSCAPAKASARAT